MATTTPAQQKAIANLYIALFNRAPDASGFDFWNQALADGGSLFSITGAFLNSSESTVIYPSSQTATAFVATLYHTVFGRTPDASGLAFWTNMLNQAGGVASTPAKALVVSKIVELVSTPLTVQPADLSYAQYAQTVADRALFAKKLDISVDFATELKSNDLVLAKWVLANLSLKMNVATEPAPAPVDPAMRFTLSTGGDTFIGGPGNDTFKAPVFAGSNSLNTHDDLDGGDGIDTLNASLSFQWREIPTLNKIEIVKLTTLGTGVMLDLRNATGVTHVGFTGGDASSDGLIFNVGAASLSVADQTSNAAFTGSTATTLSLSLSQVGSASNLSTVDLARYGAGTGTDGNGDGAMATRHVIQMTNAYVALAETKSSAVVTEVSVAATGANALSLSVADAATVKHLTVTGDGSVDFSGRVLSALDTFTGGNGAIKLTVGALSSTARIELGAGDDVITLAQGAATGATIVGGAGADTFVFNTSDVNSVAGAVTAIITDFVSGTDKIQVLNAGAGSVANFVKAGAAMGSLAAVLTAAESALNGTVHYYVGQVGNDAYLVTDIDGSGYTNVIKLTSVELAGVAAADIVA